MRKTWRKDTRAFDLKGGIMAVIRTPDELFENLADFHFVPRYVILKDCELHNEADMANDTSGVY